MPKLNSLQDLFEIMLRDAYDAEKQILHVMPKVVKHVSNPRLVMLLETQMKDAVEQQERLERAFHTLGIRPKVKRCLGMEGIIREGMDLLDQGGEPQVLDAAAIAAVQMIKHYEIAAYAALRAWSKALNHPNEVQSVLEETEHEERVFVDQLSELAIRINSEAMANTLVEVG